MTKKTTTKNATKTKWFELRTQLNLTYREMAQNLNMPLSYYWKLENRESNGSVQLLIRAVKFFKKSGIDVTMEELTS